MATALWPLEVGNSTSFSEFGSSVPNSGEGIEKVYDASWRCKVSGTESVSVAAGTFDTWRITCTRYSDSSGPSRARPREYRTWNYAPAVNHWVLEVRNYTSSRRDDKRKELVAVMPDLTMVTEDRKSLELKQDQFQRALEYNGAAIPESFTKPDQNLRVSTIPKRTFRHPDGTVCRQYEQQIVLAGGGERILRDGLSRRLGHLENTPSLTTTGEW